MPPIKVGVGEISQSGSSVTIKNVDLVNHLIHNQAAAVGVLSEIHPVKVSEVSVNKQGHVVVSNAAFAKKVGGALKDPNLAKAGNGVCGAGCGAQESRLAAVLKQPGQ